MDELSLQQHNPQLPLTDAQRAQLALFAPQGPGEPSLYDEIAGLFVDDSFAAEVDAYIQAERQRERDEAVKVPNGGNAAVMPPGLWGTSVPPSR